MLSGNSICYNMFKNKNSDFILHLNNIDVFEENLILSDYLLEADIK